MTGNQPVTNIIIIRHACKLNQNNPGPALDMQGELFAADFANYFLQQFGIPDVVIATKPSTNHKKSKSIRELQTVGPLLTECYKQGKQPQLRHTDRSTQYAELADYLLKNDLGQTIVICWEHKHINDLAKKLGVTSSLPEWQEEDYNTVYHVTLNNQQASIAIYKEQYGLGIPANIGFNDVLSLVREQQISSPPPYQEIATEQESTPCCLFAFSECFRSLCSSKESSERAFLEKKMPLKY